MNEQVDKRASLRQRTETLLDDLRTGPSKESISDGVNLVDKLRRVRDFSTMQRLAEAVSRLDSGNAKLRRLYAQSLIETGHATAAIDVTEALSLRLRQDDPEWAEARGLVGRAYKQIFADAGDPASDYARMALDRAISAYSEPFGKNARANTWHGVNLIALLDRRRRMGISKADALNADIIATELIEQMQASGAAASDHWHHATLAEAYLALRDWSKVEQHLHEYVSDERVSAFDLGSTLRQLTHIWNIEADSERGEGLVAILRARLMELPGGELDLSADALQRLGDQTTPESAQLEAILGEHGPRTWTWWQKGLGRARAVCAVREKLGSRIGTGFVVRARDFGLENGEEVLILTNYHVVNRDGMNHGLRADSVEVEFEVAAPGQRTEVDIIWQSPLDMCDATLLRLKAMPASIEPLPLAEHLARLEPEKPDSTRPRVYVVGHPGGRDLAFSFQDNELLDHEIGHGTKPANPIARRVHYRAPTEPGSSGSPVFNSNGWEVIALHHMGGRSMQRLHGKDGSYAANQGIWIQSIREEATKSFSHG